MKKRSRAMIFAVILIIAASPFIYALIRGSEDLNRAKMEASPNFSEGKAKNLEETPLMTEKSDKISAYLELFSSKNTPESPLPSIRTDLKSLDKSEDTVVWFGHSSLMVQTGGKRILTDPVLSEAGSPVPFINRPFKGTMIYEPEDIPETDYLVITHDHYDHLSKKTVKAIKDKVKMVICPLGVGKYIRNWGYPEEKITELDWGEKYVPEPGYAFHCLPARHFSGRGLFSQYSTLWAAFLFETPERKIYFGGDSGYGKHFKETGKRFGAIDLAFLENGQYDKRWRLIHMTPEETLQAAADLNAKFLMPVHNSKFKLAPHPWNEPMKRLAELHKNNKTGIILITPLIGEAAALWNKDRM